MAEARTRIGCTSFPGWRRAPSVKTPSSMRTELRQLVAVTLLVGGCAAPSHPRIESAAPPVPVTAAPAPKPLPGRASDPAPAGALAADFDELAGAIAADIGIAVAAPGSAAVTSLGSWSTGVAWSTIKVPLAIAAVRAAGSGVQPLVAQAISYSDNAAAEQLWAQLGTPETAAELVEAVLRDGGDTSTAVESRRLRPGFTAFGQTRWSLRSQAQFAARLPCIADAGDVIDLMHNIVADQRWGLAGGAAAAKGGWGPGPEGGYLVRQFGLLNTATGRIGVALAAEPYDGTFSSGIAALDRMAAWVAAHAGDLPGGSCAG